MTKALLWHIGLLLTLRHQGSGLPTKHFPTLVFTIILSALVAGAKSGAATGLIHGFILVVFASLASPPMVSGWALLSVGVDVLSMAVDFLTSGRMSIHNLFWELYEFILVVGLAFRLAKNK